MVVLELIFSVIIGFLFTELMIRRTGQLHGGVYMKRNSKYLRMHHWQLGKDLMIFGIVIGIAGFIIALLGILALLNVAAVIFGLGLGVFLHDIGDFVHSEHYIKEKPD